MSFEFPDLPYGFDALEPHIDARTMEIHWDKHHRAYFTKFTGAIEGTDLAGKSLEQIFAAISGAPGAVRNNGGGYYNHLLFWNSMGPNGGGSPSGSLGTAIESTFGTLDKFKDEFSNAGANRFGSGFAWLVVKDGKLAITSTPNQDNPLMDVADAKGEPILALDVWEHAYYLKYQNRRPDYIQAWWNTVDWKKVAERFEKAMG
ncbi:MAG: superoxide dismutase [Candidatus Eisenbacteria bacterium]